MSTDLPPSNPVPAVVTSTSPLMVQADSSDTAVPAKRLTSYTPVLADHVSVIPQGHQLLILGAFV